MNIYNNVQEISNQLLNNLDFFFSQIVDNLAKVFFVSIAGMPLIILWLIFGGLFNTFRMSFINIQGFKHAIDLARGKESFACENTEGEVSPAEALATALAGSVGLGNIAGVAIGIEMGGAGAIFWMSVAAILGMSSKFVECTLGVKYRLINPDGTVAGGPMYYLAQGLAELGLAKLGRILAFCFALFCVISTLGGSNMFQINQSLAVLATIMPNLVNYDWLFGLSFAFLVGLVIVGGISRIGVVSSKLMPVMLSFYLIACFWVLIIKFETIPHAITTIIQEAFSPHAIEGGFIGVLVQGFRRSAFSNGAGLGAAAIAHAASKTTEPIQEGIVAMLEPFVDTVIICNLTGLVIICSGIYTDIDTNVINGGQLATLAFARVINWFPYLLAIIILLFAFSTIITASYYGEQCWIYLTGQQNNSTFKIIFLISVFIGSVVNLKTVLTFSDIMLLANSIPNLIGCILLSGNVAKDLSIYWQKKELFVSRTDAETQRG